MNGIDDIATRGDLQERSLLVSLPSIPEEQRVEEGAFWADFGAARPRIFGALLEGVSAALRNAESVHLEKKPRMADFAVRATAMEECFGWEEGSFVEVYAANRQEASEMLLANEPLFDAIEELLKFHGKEPWRGTATELQKVLSHTVDESVKRSRSWPGGPQALSRRLKRIAPALRTAGIEYSEGVEGHDKKKVKTLRKLARDDKRVQEAEEALEEQARPEGEAAEGEVEHGDEPDSDAEERPVGNPFEFNFGDVSPQEDAESEDKEAE